jgi:hypothetical protein
MWVGFRGRFHTGLTPAFSPLEIGTTVTILVSDNEHEEPCEGRLSRTVLWKGRGEIPLSDQICRSFKSNTKKK